VNITLLFSLKAYQDVAHAYQRGLTRAATSKKELPRIASVASFFVSRIDTLTDQKLAELVALSTDREAVEKAKSLFGKIAIANAKLAYLWYKDFCMSPEWMHVEKRGAQRQRLLWASTGTKNKSYSDVLYVEELIGPETVNTLPPATLDAFRDHGRVTLSLEEDVKEAQLNMQKLDELGISFDTITSQLLDEGIKIFAEAFDKLLLSVESRIRELVA
jgi:transaldolase/glucose-6-phosphate isomerase